MTISQRYIDEAQFLQLLMEYEDRNHVVIEGNISEVEKIIRKYKLLCEEFRKEYNCVELDTFDNYSCLLIAIAESKLINNKRSTIKLGLDIVFKLCEEPYSVTLKDDWEILESMEKVNFDESFTDEIDAYNRYKEILINSLELNQLTRQNISLKLKCLYKKALNKKDVKRIKLVNN